jgi:hypothetical protein
MKNTFSQTQKQKGYPFFFLLLMLDTLFTAQVLEETGVHVSALRLTALREAHVKHREGGGGVGSTKATVFQTNMFLVFACKPKLVDDGKGGASHIDIIKQDHEIAKCR